VSASYKPENINAWTINDKILVVSTNSTEIEIFWNKGVRKGGGKPLFELDISQKLYYLRKVD